jgi:signal peptidase II
MGDLMKRRLIALTIILILIDQVSKLGIVSNMRPYQEIVIIKDFFSLNFVYNEGAAFSLLSGHTLLFYIFSIFALVIQIAYFIKNEHFLLLLGLTMTIAGTVGNLIDRLVNHRVTDFLSFKLLGHQFAIFNFADICVTIGVVLLVYDIFVNDGKGVKT